MCEHDPVYKELKTHRYYIRRLMTKVIDELTYRMESHDLSKLTPEEKPFFEIASQEGNKINDPKERAALIEKIKPGLLHHYRHNSHHPEHYEDLVKGMNLLDLIEMLCDWLAVNYKYQDSHPIDHIEHAQRKLGFSDEVKRVLVNTLMDIFCDKCDPE